MDAAAKLPTRSGVNWSMVIRVGAVVGVVALLLGFAAKIVWNQVVRQGIVDRGTYFEVDLKAMSNFEMDQQMGTRRDVPEAYRNLDRKKLLIEGEVAPGNLSLAGGEPSFDICFSVSQCCFNGPPKKQHFFRCIAPTGKRTPRFVASPNRVKVFGTLYIRPDAAEAKAGPGPGSGDRSRLIHELFATDPTVFFIIDLERVDPA